MVFQWKTSLVNCFRLYKNNFGVMLAISLLITICEVSFLTMMYHSYWIIGFFPVYLLFFVFVFQYGLLIGTVRIHQAFIYYSNEIIKSGRSKFKISMDSTKGRFLRGVRSYITVFLIVIVPLLAYYFSVVYIDDMLTRILVSTGMLGMVFFLSNSYQFIQISSALETKVVNDLRISTTITRMHFKSTLIYSFSILYWLSLPLHHFMIQSRGHIHLCGCSDIVLFFALILTVVRPLWILLQVVVYSHVKKTHFPVPEMDPDLRDRNLI